MTSVPCWVDGFCEKSKLPTGGLGEQSRALFLSIMLSSFFRLALVERCYIPSHSPGIGIEEEDGERGRIEGEGKELKRKSRGEKAGQKAEQ